MDRSAGWLLAVGTVSAKDKLHSSVNPDCQPGLMLLLNVGDRKPRGNIIRSTEKTKLLLGGLEGKLNLNWCQHGDVVMDAVFRGKVNLAGEQEPDTKSYLTHKPKKICYAKAQLGTKENTLTLTELIDHRLKFKA